MLGSAGSAGSAGVESWDDAAEEEETAEPAELTASDLMAEAEADAVAVQGIPEPSVERWDAEGRFGVVGRPELQQHRSGASRFGRARREPFRPGS